MATSFKPKIIDTEPNAEGKYNIKIRVSHNSQTRNLRTNFYIKKEFFNNELGKVKDKHSNAKDINMLLSKLVMEYETKMLTIDKDINIKDLLIMLKGNRDASKDLFVYTRMYIEKLNSLGRTTTAELYYYTLVKLEKYLGRDTLLFKNIDYKFLTEFETYLLIQKLKINAVSVYLRNIRKMFIEAKKEYPNDILQYPFIEFKIKSEKTRKRNLPIDVLKALKNAKLKDKQAYARDIFLLSFYLIGINLKDLYHATTIIDNRLNYKRAKNGRLYSILLIPEARKIINRYPGKTNLFNCSEVYNTVYNFRKSINKFLKQITTEMNISINPTSYYARHTWASIASKIGIDRDTISHALGHGIDSITDIYIDFDYAKVDRANFKVAKAIQ